VSHTRWIVGMRVLRRGKWIRDRLGDERFVCGWEGSEG
jgi:hypothetical protein